MTALEDFFVGLNIPMASVKLVDDNIMSHGGKQILKKKRRNRMTNHLSMQANSKNTTLEEVARKAGRHREHSWSCSSSSTCKAHEASSYHQMPPTSLYSMVCNQGSSKKQHTSLIMFNRKGDLEEECTPEQSSNNKDSSSSLKHEDLPSLVGKRRRARERRMGSRPMRGTSFPSTKHKRPSYLVQQGASSACDKSSPSHSSGTSGDGSSSSNSCLSPSRSTSSDDSLKHMLVYDTPSPHSASGRKFGKDSHGGILKQRCLELLTASDARWSPNESFSDIHSPVSPRRQRSLENILDEILVFDNIM